MVPVGFKSIEKKINQKICLGKNLAVAIVYFCYWHQKKKKKNLSLDNHFFATTKTMFMAVNRKYR